MGGGSVLAVEQNSSVPAQQKSGLGGAFKLRKLPTDPTATPTTNTTPVPTPAEGIVAPTAGGARSREKTVWDWPEIGDRLIEEWR